MHRLVPLFSLLLVACAAPGPSPSPSRVVSPAAGADQRNVAHGPFTGVWQACEGASSPDECSRYVLVQRGGRICGTWFYLATSDGYEGRVMARALSNAEARRERVCGRPGSEARTECADGWDRIDKPLRLCGGKLADTNAASGACAAAYVRVPAASEVAALAGEPWVQSCLADSGQEASR